MVQRRVLQCGLCRNKEKCLKPGLKCNNRWSSSTVQRNRVPLHLLFVDIHRGVPVTDMCWDYKKKKKKIPHGPRFKCIAWVLIPFGALIRRGLNPIQL